MSKQQINTTKSPHIHLDCYGSLRVSSWPESAVLVRGSDFDINKGEDKGDLADNLIIEGQGDLNLTVPMNAALTLSPIHGDTTIKHIMGEVNIIQAMGDVSLNDLQNVEIGTVNGDLSAHNISGSLSINEVMGDASLKTVGNVTVNTVNGDCVIKNTNGPIKVKSVMGDFSLRSIRGNIDLENVQRDINLRNLSGLVQVDHVFGDVRLIGGLIPGKHHLKADGDIVLRWPAHAPLNLEATAPHIRNRLTLTDVVEEEGHLTGRIGDGETFLILEANGRIILKDVQPTNEWEDFDGSEFDFDFSGLGEKFATEFSSRMEELSSKLEQNLGPEFAARMEEHTIKAAAKAEEAANKAMQQFEKAAKQVRWQSDHPMWKPAAPVAPTKERQATEAEQLKILKMVEKGVITPEEASTLLEAIEG
ncbi:MAG: hypothetical protein WAM60_04875 [Candidatus Promineifilaceae bacterium]